MPSYTYKTPKWSHVTCFVQKMEVLLFFNFHSSSSRIWSADIQDSRIPLSHFNCLKYSSISSRPHPEALLLSIISADVGRIVVVSSYLFCQGLTANQSQFERLLAGRASQASPTSKSLHFSKHSIHFYCAHSNTTFGTYFHNQNICTLSISARHNLLVHLFVYLLWQVCSRT